MAVKTWACASAEKVVMNFILAVITKVGCLLGVIFFSQTLFGESNPFAILVLIAAVAVLMQVFCWANELVD